MLGYLPYSSQIKLIINTNELDKWGKSLTSEFEEVRNCYIREVTTLEAQFNSKELKLKLVFGIDGNALIKAGDIVETNNIRYEIAKTRKIRDLSGEVITTLAYV